MDEARDRAACERDTVYVERDRVADERDELGKYLDPTEQSLLPASIIAPAPNRCSKH